MAAQHLQVHFHWNPGLLQPGIVGKGLLHAVDRVVFVLQKEGRRYLPGEMTFYVVLQGEAVLGNHKVTRVDGYGEIRSTAHVVRCIDSG